MSSALRSLASCAALLLAAGCEIQENNNDLEHHGTSTGAICPSGSNLSYQSFGQSFMGAYCTRCHSSTVAGGARQGAPSGADFDTIGGIRAYLNLVDAHAAAGPAAVNDGMPPSPPRPTNPERFQLGEWLACGAP